MTNKEIADVLYGIGDILELKNPNDRFRFLAYRQAGQKITTWSRELADVYEQKGIKGLEKIPAVGPSIAEKIEELIKTGKLAYLERIKKKVPNAEIEFAKIPSVGPKSARKLYRLTKAQDINELYQKLFGQTQLGKFREKSIANVLRGITLLKSSRGRHLISEVLPIAETVIAALREKREVSRADYVGSLRRMKETVGDIDLIAASAAPEETIDTFLNLVKGKVLAHGEAKATVVTGDSIQIDLEIMPAAEYGSLLQHFTGSKEHNVAFRTYLQSKGLSFSEHGIKKLKGGRWPIATFETSPAQKRVLNAAKAGETVRCADEKDVYHFAGMDYLPPEMREDRGELELAMKHQIPKLLKIDDIKGDLQMHTNRSDGTADLGTMWQKNKDLGYGYMAVTDHSQGLGIAGGQDAKKVRRQITEIKKWNAAHGAPAVLASIEVDIRANGDLDMDDELLRELDIIVGSVHSSFYQIPSVTTHRLIKAIDTGLVDILGHPTGRLLGRREGIKADWPKVFRACAARHVALEINSFPDRLDLPDNLIHVARKIGTMFVVNTDAHSPDHLSFMPYGVATARRGWLTAAEVINTWPLAKLKAWLRRT